MDAFEEGSDDIMKTTMIKNIYDQPRALRTTFEKREVFCKPWCNFLSAQSIKTVYVLGSGTSYHAALVIREYIQQFMQMPCIVSIPTVFLRYEVMDACHQYKKDEILVIGISQSGTSLSTVNAIRHAKQLGYQTLCLTEDTHSFITEYSDVIVPLLCGREGIPIETRGYSVTVLTGLLMALAAAKLTDKLGLEDYFHLLYQLEASLPLFDTVITKSDAWQNNNKERLLRMTKGAVCGYGYNYMSAKEASLKVYETFHQPIYGYEMEEMIHGYEMAFDEEQYVYMMAGKGEELLSLNKFRNFLDDIGVQQFVITCEDIDIREHDLKIDVDIPSVLDPITYVLPFQVLAARNCEMIGYDTSVYPHHKKSFSHKRD